MSRIILALRGFVGTVLLGVLLFGVPFSAYGLYRAAVISDISGKYTGKDGKPITSLSVFIDHCGVGASIGAVSGFIPGICVAICRLKKTRPTT